MSGLLYALLDEGEWRFQEAFMTGPPPLGPGAPPPTGRAFLHTLADRVVEQQAIMRAVEAASPQARYLSGPYAAVHLHVSMLLRQVRPEADPTVLAYLLLSPFVPSLFEHLTLERGLTLDQIKAGIDDLLGL